MRIISAEAVDRALDYAELADRLADGFALAMTRRERDQLSSV